MPVGLWLTSTGLWWMAFPLNLCWASSESSNPSSLWRAWYKATWQAQWVWGTLLLLARSERSRGLWNCISSSWSPGGLAGQHCQSLFRWEPGPFYAGQDFPYEGSCWSWATTLSEMGLLNIWDWLHLLKIVCGNCSLEIKWELGSVNTHILRQTLYVKLVCEAKELGLHPVVNGEPWRM